MTSSPGPIPSASTEVCKACVPEPVATQNFVPIKRANFFSSVGTVPEVDWILHHIPLFVVFKTEFSTFLSQYGHLGQDLLVLTGLPPRIASLPAFPVKFA